MTHGGHACDCRVCQVSSAGAPLEYPCCGKRRGLPAGLLSFVASARDLFLKGNQVINRDRGGVEPDQIFLVDSGPLPTLVIIVGTRLRRAEALNLLAVPKR